MQVIPPTGYSIDAANRQITLQGPWAHLQKANILKIFNFTTNDLLFDPDNRARLGVSVSGGVISFDNTTGNISDTDELLIAVESDIPDKDQRVQAGALFRDALKMDIASGASRYLLLDIGAKDAHMDFDLLVDGDTQVEIYLGPTVTSKGTKQVTGNFNFNYLMTKVPLTSFYDAPTVTNEGVYIGATWAFGGSGSVAATAKHAVVTTTPTEVILPANTMFLLKIINHADRLLQAFYIGTFHEEEPPV